MKVVCKDCKLDIGWYIATAGAVRLMPEWYIERRR